MIKIFSGHSNVGGSTEVFINMTNAFNAMGHETMFYGPMKYPEGRCNFTHWTNKTMDIQKDDNVIVHLVHVDLNARPACKTFLFHIHEMEMFPLKNSSYFLFDKIVYVSQHQKEFHNVRHPSVVIPNPFDVVECDTHQQGVAGVVGWIQRNKGTAKSIKSALEDGFEKVLIYGTIGDPNYWYDEVAPLIDGERVEYLGYEEDKNKIYSSISTLYISSDNESFSLSANEACSAGCEVVTNTRVVKAIGTNPTNEEIYKMWLKEFNLD